MLDSESRTRADSPERSVRSAQISTNPEAFGPGRQPASRRVRLLSEHMVYSILVQGFESHSSPVALAKTIAVADVVVIQGSPIQRFSFCETFLECPLLGLSLKTPQAWQVIGGPWMRSLPQVPQWKVCALAIPGRGSG